ICQTALERASSKRSSFDKGLFDHEVTRLGMIALDKAARHEHCVELFEHRRAAAQHDAIRLPIEAGKVDVFKQLIGCNQIGDAAAVAERLAGDGRIVNELVLDQGTKELVTAQVFHEVLAVGEF